MIAVDTSSFIAYLQGEEAKDTRWIKEAISGHVLVFPPMVLSEILSDISLPARLIKDLTAFPLLSLHPNFWSRAGMMRAELLAKSYKARLADTFIAQVCIDNDVPLITRDNDFRHFVKFAGLTLFDA